VTKSSANGFPFLKTHVLIGRGNLVNYTQQTDQPRGDALDSHTTHNNNGQDERKHMAVNENTKLSPKHTGLPYWYSGMICRAGTLS